MGETGDVWVPGDHNGDAEGASASTGPRGTTSANWGVSLDVPLPLPYAVWKPYYRPG